MLSKPVSAAQSESPAEKELRSTLNSLSAELHKLDDIHWISPLMQCSEEVGVFLVVDGLVKTSHKNHRLCCRCSVLY